MLCGGALGLGYYLVLRPTRDVIERAEPAYDFQTDVKRSDDFRADTDMKREDYNYADPKALAPNEPNSERTPAPPSYGAEPKR